jgi:2-desacetyl-2-hydroxyethyl bacteriochlorophyllide A dehydrogenase
MTIPATTHAIRFDRENAVSFACHRLPACGEQDIVVKTLYTMISPGTELRMLAGHYGAAGQFPYIPGYNSISRVLAVGAKAVGFRVGDLVSGINPQANGEVNCMYGAHAGHQVLATGIDQRPVLLPDDADPRAYAITELASIAYRGVTAARPQPAETAIVIGQGIIGACSAAFLAAAGCRVAVIDLDDARLARARCLGVSTAIKAGQPDTTDRALAFTRFGADIVVEASGSTPGVQLAYQLLRRKPKMPEGQYVREPIHFYAGDFPRLVWQANYLEPIPLDPHGVLPGEGAVTIASGDRGIEDRHRVIEALRRGQIRSDDFLDLVTTPDQAPAAYAALQKRERFSVLFDWSDIA